MITKVSFIVDVRDNFLKYGYHENLYKEVYNRIPSYPYHDEISTHSVGWVRSDYVKPFKDGYFFGESCKWSFGIVVDGSGKYLREFIKSLDKNNEIIEGVKVKTPSVLKVGNENEVEYWAESPILVRRDNEHLKYSDPDIDEFLTRSIRSKLMRVGIPQSASQDVKAEFINSDKGEVKLVSIGNLEYKANFCPIKIEAPSEFQQIILGTGVGHLTGCSFGSIIPKN